MGAHCRPPHATAPGPLCLQSPEVTRFFVEMTSVPPPLWRWRFIGCYFGIVFGVAFVLGVFRVLVCVPLMGERWAELIELPLLAIFIALVARRLVRKLTLPGSLASRLLLGLLPMLLVLIADGAVGIGLRSQTVSEAFLDRDPVSGTVYYLTLLWFGLAPWWFSRPSS